MSVAIKLKRGTEAAVLAATLSDYEIAFASDTKSIIVYDGTNKKKYLASDSTELAEVIADVIGGMISSNTETMISVTYDDGDNTLDFVIDATATPTASKIPIANASGNLAAGWGGAASTLATLNALTKVVEDPANATATATASKIPIADGSGKLDTWVTYGTAESIADLIGAMVGSNTETMISVSYDDADNTLDFVIDATATPTASKIPIADGSGKLAAGWGGAASTLATLDSNTLVVQNPANATATQAISKIPISDADGTVDTWITTPLYDVYPDQLELDFVPLNYTNTPSPSSVTSRQLASHLQGIDNTLKSILDRLTAHSI
jgi:hypothetical protein